MKVFVETGTYHGETIKALKNNFDVLYSIELSVDLYNKAKTKFNKCTRINIYNGNSADILPRIVAQLDAPALYWLDAHFSGGITASSKNPILQEILTILQAGKSDVIVIDDLRLFGTDPDYPKYYELKDYVNQIGKGKYAVHTGPDCIVITPSTTEHMSQA